MRSSLTIIDAATERSLTTLEAVKLELGIGDSDTTEDALLTAQIAQKSAAAANWCRRPFALETVQETFWPGWDDRALRDGAPLCLGRYPVAAIASVTQDGDALESGDLYRLDGEGDDRRLLYRLTDDGDPACWTFCRSAVVEYLAGYDLPDDVPADIEAAIIAWVKDGYFAAGSNVRDPRLRSEQNYNVATFSYFDRAGGSTSSGSAVRPPPDVELVLDAYRRKV
jgi:hypothetical protein